MCLVICIQLMMVCCRYGWCHHGDNCSSDDLPLVLRKWYDSNALKYKISYLLRQVA